MNYGLMIDDIKTQKVSAQIVVYNAELGYFGNVMVFFEFSEGGKVQVTHAVNTIKVELYDSDADMFRLAMEVVLCLGVIWSVYEELMDVFETKKATGTYARSTSPPFGTTLTSRPSVCTCSRLSCGSRSV